MYHSLLKVKGRVDAVLTASNAPTAAEAIRPKIAKNKGLLLGSEDCVKLNAFVACLEGKGPENIGYLKLAASYFGSWDENDLVAARKSGVRVF